MKKTLLAVLLFIAAPVSAPAQNIPDPPDVSDWPATADFIEAKVSDLTSVFLGFDLTHVNPANPNEFVRVIRRAVPRVMIRAKEDDQRSFAQSLRLNFSDQERRQTLDTMRSESEPVVYVKWRVQRDDETGQTTLDGRPAVWLLDSTGAWNFDDTGRPLAVETVSEYVNSDVNKNVLVGRRYSLGGRYHVLMADYYYVTFVLEKSKEKGGTE